MKTNVIRTIFSRIRSRYAPAVASCAALMFASAALVWPASAFAADRAASAPAELKIGTLYASTGPFAVSSQAQFAGLKFWVDETNKQGGVPVKAFGKKIPLKLVAYDDQSSTSTATTLYNQLITQDKVDLLVADFGSVLTSVAIPIAAEHHMLLINPTGAGESFFRTDNPYLALVSLPVSKEWPVNVGQFLLQHQIKRVAIIYGSNDFGVSQAGSLRNVLAGGGVTPVYYQAVPTTESNYMVLLHSIAATHPDAVIEFGYPDNDIAFLKTLKSSGLHFNMVLTVYPGQLPDLITKNVGPAALAWTYTYPAPPVVRNTGVNAGMNIDDFVKGFTASASKQPNFMNVAGYNAGVVIETALGIAPQFSQLALRDALGQMSGKTRTALGEFKIDAHGAQYGDLFPLAQFVPNGGANKFVIVYPKDVANGQPTYPAPH